MPKTNSRHVPLSDITHEEDRDATEARIAEAYVGQRQDRRFEKRYRHKDGRVVWADVSTVFVPASGSNANSPEKIELFVSTSPPVR